MFIHTFFTKRVSAHNPPSIKRTTTERFLKERRPVLYTARTTICYDHIRNIVLLSIFRFESNPRFPFERLVVITGVRFFKGGFCFERPFSSVTFKGGVILALWRYFLCYKRKTLWRGSANPPGHYGKLVVQFSTVQN